MKRITDGERPSRPSGGKKLGLSDELWEVIQSSLAQEAEERCPLSRFINFLEKATPDTAVLKALAEFDANNEEHITKLRRMFGCGDNTLLGMREEETLTVIEVFDRVKLPLTAFSWFSDVSDSARFQVLSSSLGDSKLRSRCLRGLQKVSARCGILPKSYWIAHSTSAEPNDVSSATRRASSTRQRLIDGKLVAVKTIGPDCIDNFNTFKYARSFPLPEYLLSISCSIWVLTEIMHQCGRVEATAASKCGQFPWARLGCSPFLACVPLDA